MQNSSRLTLILSLLAGCDALPAAANAPRALDDEPSCDRAAPEPSQAVEHIDVGDSPILGPKDAPVTVVVYSDFECPFCKKGAIVAAELAAKYPGRVKIAFKHNPLPFHARAPRAALATIAASKQGKFWELHDRLFFEADGLEEEDLLAHAKAVGLDIERFQKDLDLPSTRAVLDADVAEAKRLGVQGTPTFFVDGRRVVGAQPLEAFVKLLK